MKTGTVTSKGQITIPIKWRRKFGNPEKVELIERKDGILVRPVEEQEKGWTTIYKAPKNGKGMKGEELIALINKINDEQDRKVS